MQNNFRELEELVFFDLWISSSFICGFQIPDSGFRFRIPDSGFRIPVSGFRVLGLPNTVNSNKRIGIFSAEIFIIQVVYFVEILLIQTQVVNSNHFALKASNCLRSAS